MSQDVQHCPTDAASVLQQKVLLKTHQDTGVGANQKWIPPQLVMTGVFTSLDDLPLAAKTNLEKTRAQSPGLTFRYLNDLECWQYLQEHFDDELSALFYAEKHGSFRGDICRSAVLLREGGFYMDLDLQLHVPIQKLIDEDTTLMTAFIAPGPWIAPGHPISLTAKLGSGSQVSIQPILNAMIAVRPKSPVMEKTLKHIRAWYKGNREGLLGPLAMAKAIGELVQNDCPMVPVNAASHNIVSPGHDGADAMARWVCGSENFRFYQEEYFGSGPDCLLEGHIVCPEKRASSPFAGSHFGLFSMGNASKEARLIGWSRYLGCDVHGCNLNGGEMSF